MADISYYCKQASHTRINQFHMEEVHTYHNAVIKHVQTHRHVTDTCSANIYMWVIQQTLYIRTIFLACISANSPPGNPMPPTIFLGAGVGAGAAWSRRKAKIDQQLKGMKRSFFGAGIWLV